MIDIQVKPYPAYKDSGIHWMGGIPEHWELIPGKACYQEKMIPNSGLKESTVLSLSYGRIVIKPENKLHGLVPASFETYQIVEPHDIIVRPTDLQNDWNSLRYGISCHRGIITSAYICLKTKPQMNCEYGHLLLHTYDLKKIFYGLGSGLRQNLDWSDFKYLPCLRPPVEEQTAIVHYLDYIDRRIRRYINSKKKLIALFNEQKQAIIHRAVTGGLDPNVTLKSSGIEWLCDIPEHWETNRIKNLARSGRKAFIDGDWIELPYITSEGVRLIQTGNIGIGIYKEKGFRYISSKTCESFGCTLIDPSDVLICRLGDPVARACLAPELGVKMITSVDVCILKTKKDVNSKFLVYAMSDDSFLEWVASIVRGSTRDRISRSMLGAFKIQIPPTEEQMAISRCLDNAVINIDAVINNAKRQINLIREYSRRLISDVVTGKLDVRETAASLPEEVEEQISDDDSERLIESDSLEEGNDEPAGESDD